MSARRADTVVYLIQDMLEVKKDGKWGPRTQTAYDLASAATRSEVDSVLAREGYSVETLKLVTYDLKSPNFKLRPGVPSKQSGYKPVGLTIVQPKGAAMTEVPQQPTARWIPERDLDLLIRQVGEAQGVDPKVLKGFIDLEANKRVGRMGREYDAQSTSPGAGTFKGLGQMGAVAWGEVQARIGGLPYSRAFDPRANLTATAAYIKLNMTYARNKGYKGPFTPAVLYTLHNQGAGGFMRLLSGGAIAGGQSKNANTVIAQAIVDGRTMA